VAWTNGLQSENKTAANPRGFLQTAATLKHFVGNSLESWCQGGPTAIGGDRRRRLHSGSGKDDVFTLLPEFTGNGDTEDDDNRNGNGSCAAVEAAFGEEEDWEEEYCAVGPCTNRNAFNVVVGAATLNEYYLPPYKMAVQLAAARSFMTSENAVDGMSMAGNQLLRRTRDAWSFTGFMTSDCGGVEDITGKGEDSLKAAAADAILAGNDLECADRDDGGVFRQLPAALKSGLVQEHGAHYTVDAAVSNVLRVQMELGEFDDAATVPWKDSQKFGKEAIDSPYNRQLAREAAEQSIVLLQNSEQLIVEEGIRFALPLPVPTAVKPLKVALVGPHSTSSDALLGAYVTENLVVQTEGSLRDKLAAMPGVNLTHRSGCTWDDECKTLVGIAKVEDAVRQADVTILAVGSTENCDDIPPGARNAHTDESGGWLSECESEGHDRWGLGFAFNQGLLIEKVIAVAREGERKGKVVGVVIHGGQLDLGPLLKADAILDAHHPGQFGAQAVLDIIFGRVNPSGRLASTIYASNYSTEYRPDMTDMDPRGDPSKQQAGRGSTYLHYTGRPQFQFGHGLSYTLFKYQFSRLGKNGELEVSSTLGSVVRSNTSSGGVSGAPSPSGVASLAVVFHQGVTVKNIGTMVGSTVVLGFISAPDVDQFPIRRLFDFARVGPLAPNAKATVTLTASAADFAISARSAAARPTVYPGTYRIHTGDPGDTLEDMTTATVADLAGQAAAISPALCQKIPNCADTSNNYAGRVHGSASVVSATPPESGADEQKHEGVKVWHVAPWFVLLLCVALVCMGKRKHARAGLATFGAEEQDRQDSSSGPAAGDTNVDNARFSTFDAPSDRR
jgi:beta-glucosidase-like glycosyl hydrolase